MEQLKNNILAGKHMRKVLILLLGVFVSFWVTAQAIEPSAEHLTQMTREANKLLDRTLIIGQSPLLQRESLRLIAEEFQVALQHWPQTSNIAVEAKLARIALLIGFAYQYKVNDTSSAAAIYDVAIQRWWMRNESDIAQHITYMLLQYGSIIEGLQADKALQLYDKAILQYARVPDLGIQASVIKFLGAKGRLLIKLGRVDEGLAAFDNVQDRYPNPIHATLTSAVAGSNFAKADILYSQLGRRDEATTLLNATLKRWDMRPEPDVQQTMAFVVARLANDAFEQAKPTEAFVLNEDLLQRASKLKIYSLVLSARSRTPLLLFNQKKYNESITACDQFISLYEKSTALNEQYFLARTMLLKGDNLFSLYLPQEAIKTYQQMIDRFKSSAIPNISLLLDDAEKRKQVAQGNTLRMLR